MQNLLKNDANLALDLEAQAARSIVRVPPSNISALTPAGGAGGPVSAPACKKIRRGFNLSTVGDNVLIPGVRGFVLEIYELSLYNLTQQNITLVDSQDLVPLSGGPITNFPGQATYFLGDQDEPHFELKEGGSFVINLSAGTQVVGYVRHRQRAV